MCHHGWFVGPPMISTYFYTLRSDCTEAHKGHHCKYFFPQGFFLFPQVFFLFPQGYFLFPQGYFLFPQGLFYFRKVCFISARFVLFPQGYIISARFILFPQGYFYFPEVSSFIFSIWVSPMPISLHYCSKRAITPNDLGLPVPWWLPLKIFSRKLK